MVTALAYLETVYRDDFLLASMRGWGIPSEYGEVRVRCVLVDDDDTFLRTARALLEQQGVSVVGTARGCAEALDRTQAMRPDVVLIDICLGEESGFEVARQLASNGPAAALIMISTHAEADYASLIAENPVDGFLAKADLSAAAIRRLVG